jgi:hypothetical protein
MTLREDRYAGQEVVDRVTVADRVTGSKDSLAIKVADRVTGSKNSKEFSPRAIALPPPVTDGSGDGSSAPHIEPVTLLRA